jgi:hypothetical protein
MKKILDLSMKELEALLQKDIFPSEISFEGLEEHPSFNRLFKHRNNPKLLATLILKERIRSTISDSSSIKDRRLLLKEKELELKERKGETISTQIKELKQLLFLISKKLDVLINK